MSLESPAFALPASSPESVAQSGWRRRPSMYVSAWQGLHPLALVRPARRQARPYPLDASHRTGFYVARNAIYHLTRALRCEDGAEVLMPAYHSGNEVAAVRAAGASVRFYSIDRRLGVDLEELERLCRARPRVLLVIHFMGWAQPMREIRRLCAEHEVTLVEDCALSLLSELDGQPLGSFGDYSVFCLYKTLAVPSGGLLVQNGEPLPALQDLQLDSCGLLSTLARASELGLEWLRMSFDRSGRTLFWCKRRVGSMLSAAGISRVPVGDMDFRIENAQLGMPPLVERLLRRFDYGDIKRRRRRNFELLRERLDGKVTMLDRDLEPGMCPLFFPILVEDKQDVGDALARRGIQATQFWNTGDADAGPDRFPDAHFLRRHVLELPIHQGLGPKQIDYMAGEVERLGLRPLEDDRQQTQVG